MRTRIPALVAGDERIGGASPTLRLLSLASDKVGDAGPAFVLTYLIDETTLIIVEDRSGKRL
jgi:hypothetical protein